MTTSHTVRGYVAVPPAAVYAALTERPALQTWLAEFAEVSLSEGVFGFWGRFTPAGERDSQRLLGYEPDSRLSFAWTFQGAQTQVDVELEPSGPGTVITLTHSGVPERLAGAASVDDFWLLSLANLASYAEGRELGPKCELTISAPGEVRASVEIAAAASEVFGSLIEPAQLDRWIAEKAEVEPEPGGRIDFGWDGGGPVKILDLDPDRVLAYSWQYPPDEPDTVVRWELEGSGGRTRLTIVHSGFGERSVDDYQLGWQQFLVSLKRMLEVGESWRRFETVTA